MPERLTIVSEKVQAVKRTAVKIGLPFLASLMTLASTACGIDLNWKVAEEYPDCGFYNSDPGKNIPADHLVWIKRESRFLTPDRLTLLSDQGVDPTCQARVATTPPRIRS